MPGQGAGAALTSDASGTGGSEALTWRPPRRALILEALILEEAALAIIREYGA